MIEKYFIKLTTEGEYGVEHFVMEIKDDKHDMAGPFMTLIAGVINNVIEITTVIKDANGITQTRTIPIDQIVDSFNKINGMLSDVELSPEQAKKLIDKLEEDNDDSSDE